MWRVVASLNPTHRSTFRLVEDNSGDKLGKTLGAKMAKANPWKTLGAIEFVETASRQRAVSYRERAAHLSVMADEEPNGSLRTKLLELATQYEELAISVATSGSG